MKIKRDVLLRYTRQKYSIGSARKFELLFAAKGRLIA